MSDEALDSLSPEARLLLAIGRRFGGWEEITPIGELVRRDLNWPLFMAAARWHKLDAVLTRVPEMSDTPLSAELRSAARDYAMNAMVLASGLVRIQTLLAAHDIPFLQIKGLSVAQMAYGDLALRPSLDLDIIMSPRHVNRALELLAEAGFRPYESETVIQKRMRTRIDGQTALTDGAVSLDLHWSFSLFPEMFPLNAEQAIERAGRLSIGGRELSILRFDDMLCFLCFHGSKHLWSRLFWILDIALLSKDLAAEDFPEERIRELGQEQTVAQGFLLAHELFGSTVPRAVSTWSEEKPRIKQGVDSVLDLLFRQSLPEDRYEIGIPLGRKMLWESGLFGGFGTRARILGRYMFQPATADLRSLPLPSYLFPLYYLYRPARLILRELFRKTVD